MPAVHGSAEVATLCPKCSATRKPENQKKKCCDCNTETGLIHCNNCGWSAKANIIGETYRPSVPQRFEPKEYKRPGNDDWKRITVGDATYKFEKEQRGFDESWLKSEIIKDQPLIGKFEYRYGRYSDITTPVVAFLYWQGNELINIQYRCLEKDKGNSLRFIPGAEQIPFNVNAVEQADTKSVLFAYITEGQQDAMAILQTIAHYQMNAIAVSVPAGCQSIKDGHCFDPWKRKFLQFQMIVIAGDQDEPGKEMRNKLITYFGVDKTASVESWTYTDDGQAVRPDQGGAKDANECLIRYGFYGVKKALMRATPARDLTDYVDCTPVDAEAPGTTVAVDDDETTIGGDVLPKVDRNTVLTFPIETFNEPLQNLINTVANVYDVPLDFCIPGLYAATSIAVGTKLRYWDGVHKNWACLWQASVGRSGDGKSEPIRWFLGPITDADKAAAVENQPLQQAWIKGGRIGQEPKATRHTIGDITMEATMLRLSEYPDGLLQVRDELAGLFKSFDRYHGGGGDAQQFIELWEGVPQTVDRKGQPSIFVNAPCPFVGTIQPGLIANTFNQDGADTSGIAGFLQRILFFYGGERHQRNFKRKGVTMPIEAAQSWAKYIRYLSEKNWAEIPEPLDAPQRWGFFEPFIFPNAEAIEVYQDFCQKYEDVRGEQNDFIASLISKANINVLRVAMILHWLADYPNVNTNFDITKEEMTAAARQMDLFFIPSAEKIYLEYIGGARNPRPQMGLYDRIRALWELLLQRGLPVKQNDFARSIGIDPGTISKVLGGKK